MQEPLQKSDRPITAPGSPVELGGGGVSLTRDVQEPQTANWNDTDGKLFLLSDHKEMSSLRERSGELPDTITVHSMK